MGHDDVVYFVFNGGKFKNSASFVELIIPGGNKICAVSFYIKVATFLDYEGNEVE